MKGVLANQTQATSFAVAVQRGVPRAQDRKNRVKVFLVRAGSIKRSDPNLYKLRKSKQRLKKNYGIFANQGVGHPIPSNFFMIL